MFGYVKPYHPELLVKEYEFYKSVYCGVCRSMKKCTGALSNVLHSYDSVFLALVRMLYVSDEAIGVKKQRCIAHPLKKKNMLKTNEATDYTAKAFGILTYYKIKDDISDERIMKKMATSLLRPIFSKAKNRANMVEIARVCHDKLAEINRLESERTKSVDEPARLFGELLGAVFAEGLEGSDKLVCYTVGFHLGKFIYAADAAEDYEKDKKRGKYNPFVIIYGERELTEDDRKSIKTGLILECQKLETAIDLLPFGNKASIENIIRNIIYCGLIDRISFLDGENKKEKISEGSV